MTESPADSTSTLRAAAAAIRELASGESRGWVRLLESIHEDLLRLRVESGPDVEPFRAELADLGAALGEVPDRAVRRCEPRLAVLIALLRGGFYAPAWLLIWDNASGRVEPSRAVATWAGRSSLRTPLPLPVHVEDRRVFGWLPGFRDPRWAVPDAVYEVSVTAEVQLDHAAVEDGMLRMWGAASLTALPTAAEDEVTVRLHGPEVVEIPAERARRPDLELPRGVERDRLAWSGWAAEVPLAGLAPGTWSVSLAVTAAGASRQAAVGVHRGVLYPVEVTAGQVEVRGSVVSLGAARGKTAGQLQLHIRRLPWRTRMVPKAARDRLRGR